MELKNFQIDLGREWDHVSYGDGYDVMEAVDAHGWVPVPWWSGDDLLEWPYAIAFVKNDGATPMLATYYEGDVSVYAFDTPSQRKEALDHIALAYRR